MKKVTDPEFYKALIGAFEKGSCLSNCYFLMNKVRELISKDKLFYDLYGGNLFLYEKEDSFYRFYYWIKNDENLFQVTCDMPVVVEFVYQEELSNQQEKAIGLLQRMGFSLGRRSARMAANGESIKTFPLRNDQIVVASAKIEECKTVYQLFRGEFNPLYAYLPTEDELRILIDAGDIYVALCENEIVGASDMGKEKNQAWMRHMVIKEDYRGMGIASRLENAAILNNLDARNFFCWVDLSNDGAIRLHRKFGYEFDGRKADEYVIK